METEVFDRAGNNAIACASPFQPNREAGSRKPARRGQAMVEFALALPVFLLVVYGLLEVGRLIFMEATVITASREAARYASAWGRIGTNGDQQFQDCAGIRGAARQVGFLLNLSGTTNNNVHIYLDDETPPQAQPPTLYEYCTTSGLAVDTNVGEGSAHPVTAGDRVVVTVNATYQPILPLFLPLTTKNMTSTTSRTLLGVVDLPTLTP
jgi:Flp pilus assembly protein TadG